MSGTEPRLSSVSVFFPCYNDANTIPGLVRSVEGALKTVTDDYEIIVVDDGSKDESRDLVRSMMAEFTSLRLVEHAANRGYGGALRSGFESAVKDYVFYTDGDGQYDPSELVVLAREMRPGVDVVNGYKISRQDPWYRQIIGGAYQFASRIAFGLPIRDVDCDFRLLRRSVFDRMTLESNDGAICIELVRKLRDSGLAHGRGPSTPLRPRLRHVAVLQAPAHRPRSRWHGPLVRPPRPAARAEAASQSISPHGRGRGHRSGGRRLKLSLGAS